MCKGQIILLALDAQRFADATQPWTPTDGTVSILTQHSINVLRTSRPRQSFCNVHTAMRDGPEASRGKGTRLGNCDSHDSCGDRNELLNSRRVAHIQPYDILRRRSAGRGPPSRKAIEDIVGRIEHLVYRNENLAPPFYPPVELTSCPSFDSPGISFIVSRISSIFSTISLGDLFGLRQ
jgi:hypothetical protein